jgi:primosomal protein N' (replication factor Y) (superfamily II helicase)
VILGSATPSLESWYHSLNQLPVASREQTPTNKRARYLRIDMPSRIGHASLPQLQRVDMNFQPKYTMFSPPLLKAIRQRIENSQQVLILLNRRGYSPVLYCSGCGWKSQCNQCSAFKVFHKADRTLRCHHCGDTQRVPKKCPVCSNQDITMLGMGTERIEETLLEALSDLSKAKSERIQIMRIDADSTKTKGSLQAQLDRVHSGEVEVLIGTQMIAKGHDFRRVTLVAALEVDGALYSNDFRSTERLFALLMQAAGRSGRDVHFNSSQDCELWVQTFNPKHPVFEFLKNHDYAGFANHQLLERQQANMPPFCSQALIKAESRSQENAQKFLLEIKALADSILHARVKSGQLPSLEHILVFSPIPMNMRKIANLERAQLLIESQSRKYLQSFLLELKLSMQLKSRDFTSVHRWVIDIDPHTL